MAIKATPKRAARDTKGLTMARRKGRNTARKPATTATGNTASSSTCISARVKASKRSSLPASVRFQSNPLIFELLVGCLITDHGMGSTERDSRKDEAVVFIFIFATAALLGWAAVKPWVKKFISVSFRSFLLLLSWLPRARTEWANFRHKECKGT